LTQDLHGRTCWITGAGTGIGRAVAQAFGAAGCRLALTGRTRDTLAETQTLVEAAGGSVMLAAADVGWASEVTRAHRAVVDALGAVEILVNSAGTNVPRRNWRHLSAADMELLVDVNLKGPFLCSLAVLPAMRERGAGTLIHIVSNAATGIFSASGPAYTAAKHGARAMSATLNAEEGIHGIRSVCINPGEVATPILDKRPHPPTAAERAMMVQPEDVAASAVFAAAMPARSCLAEILITPTDNAFYRNNAKVIAGMTL
jgi:NADP-dependent 3-hydroxy acid dehydrogenase YdfG